MAAAESELRWQQERVEPTAAKRSIFTVPGRRARPDADSRLRLMPATGPAVVRGTRQLELSTRHAELLTLLSWHPRGLSGEKLVDLLHVNPDAADLGTLRAELVRLRKVLSGFDKSLVPLSRPYRLAKVPRSDAREVLTAIESGDLDAALKHYDGPVIERSSARASKRSVRKSLPRCARRCCRTAPNSNCCISCRPPKHKGDEELLSTTLQVLPARSPHRALIVAALERLEANG